MTAIFEKGSTVQITGIQKDCECFHCGRPLKVGVVLDGFGGAFGSDCLARAANIQVVGNIKVKLNGEAMRKRAIVSHKGAEYADRAYGWELTGPNFKFTLKSALNWKE